MRELPELTWRARVISAFLVVAVISPVAFMAMDRSPPFRRTGSISATSPTHCEIEGEFAGVIVPGGCAKLVLHIENLRSCRRGSATNVTRTLTDSRGVTKSIGVAKSEYSGQDNVEIVHYFIVPSPMPKGRTLYFASACFSCNPLQSLLGWPVCVDGPPVPFDVE